MTHFSFGMLGKSTAPFHAGAVDFNGSNQDYRRSSSFPTNTLVNSPECTFSLWFRTDGGDGTSRVLFCLGANTTANFVEVLLQTSALTNPNDVRVVSRNASNTFLMQQHSATAYTYSPTWHHLIGSFKTGDVKVYVDGGLQISSTSVPSSGNMPWATANRMGIGVNNQSPAQQWWNGCISELWVNNGWLDLTDPANIAKFRSPATGKPVFLGPSGQLPTGLSPAIYHSGDVTTFATNRGTLGGALAASNTPTNASTSPSD